MKYYITFGEIHAHSVNGITFDKDCVAVIEAETREDAKEIAYESFLSQYCFMYNENQWDTDDMEYYRRGYLAVNQQ